MKNKVSCLPPNLSHAEQAMGHGWCSQSDVGQPFDHSGQIKASVETVFELGKVTRHMFFSNRMEGSRQRSLDVAEQRIHPFTNPAISHATSIENVRNIGFVK